MKLLRSTFVAFYLSMWVVSAFHAPQVAIARRGTPLFVGIHDQKASQSQLSEEEIQKELRYQATLSEIDGARGYLEWLVESENDPELRLKDPEEGGMTFADLIKQKAEEAKDPEKARAAAEAAGKSGGDIGLFGGTDEDPELAAPDLQETTYRPALREDLGSTVLLTGNVMDPSLLNILNNNIFGQTNVPNFKFTTIKALVDDVAAVKKGAISRQARYSGLLDKLVIEPASAVEPKVSASDLEGVTSWILQVDASESEKVLGEVAELANSVDALRNVVALVVGAEDMSSVPGADALVAAGGTVLAVGELYDGGMEGGYYHVGPLGPASGMTATEGQAPRMSKKMAYQLVAHSLAIESTSSSALGAYEYSPEALSKLGEPYLEEKFAERDDDGEFLPDEFKDVKMEGRLIRALRESGFTGIMELDVLLSKGIEVSWTNCPSAPCYLVRPTLVPTFISAPSQNFKQYIANPPVKESPFAQIVSERDAKDKEIMAMLEAESKKNEELALAREESSKQREIEQIAQEWAIKEYSLKMIGGDLDKSTSEKEYVKSVWDTAMVEAKKTYERVTSAEYAKELARKEVAYKRTDELFWEGMDETEKKKRQVMLERIKKQYMGMISEEDMARLVMEES